MIRIIRKIIIFVYVIWKKEEKCNLKYMNIIYNFIVLLFLLVKYMV